VLRNARSRDQRTRAWPQWKPSADPGINNNLAAFGTILVLMVTLNLLWLQIVTWPLYSQGLVHLMADSPKLPVAALFYAVYALGLLIFAVAPPGLRRNPPGVMRAARSGGLFGLFAFATYGLTNLSTLKDWPAMLAIIDITWGTVLSAVCAAAGKRVWDRFAAA
jgi:uncharacterized membrane protein